MENLIIKRPHIDDVPQIEDLFSITIQNNFKEEGISDPQGEEVRSEIESLKKTLALDFKTNGIREYFLVASSSDRILGTIAYGSPNSIITKHLQPEDQKIPEVKSVYVLPAFQNQGIGSQLFTAMLKLLSLQKINAFYLDSGYRKAQQFWTKRLGPPNHTLPNYWSAGNPHMIWHRQVAELIQA